MSGEKKRTSSRRDSRNAEAGKRAGQPGHYAILAVVAIPEMLRRERRVYARTLAVAASSRRDSRNAEAEIQKGGRVMQQPP